MLAMFLEELRHLTPNPGTYGRKLSRASNKDLESYFSKKIKTLRHTFFISMGQLDNYVYINVDWLF